MVLFCPEFSASRKDDVVCGSLGSDLLNFEITHLVCFYSGLLEISESVFSQLAPFYSSLVGIVKCVFKRAWSIAPRQIVSAKATVVKCKF